VVLQSDIRPGEEVIARKLIATVRGWLSKPSGTLFTLLGDFGSGKTSFCQRLACELALAARDDATARRPVVVDLREGGSTTVTFENLLIDRCQRLLAEPVNPQALLHLNREGHLVLIFDGFDEIIGYSEPGRFVENLWQILRACEGKAKVLLTCRTHYFRDQPEEVRQLGKARAVLTSEGATQLYEELRDQPGVKIGYLREFGDDEIAEYLRKALPPPADWQAFREEIRRTYNLEDLTERPFLLEMIVKTLPKLRADDRAEVTIADLYEAYCESWFEKSDFRLTLTREHKVALVEYLARLLWDTPEQRVHYQDLAERAVAFFSDLSLSPFDKERIDFEVRTALFLHRDAAGYYSFIHRSFLEFFVARTLRQGLARGDRQCLNLRRLPREVAFFLELWPEREKIPELAASVLAGAYQKRVSENAVVLLHLHCRAGLGPLAGSGSELHQDDEGLDRLRRAFVQARPREAMQLAGADFSGAELCGVDLGGAVLRGTSFERAELRGASAPGRSRGHRGWLRRRCARGARRRPLRRRLGPLRPHGRAGAPCAGAGPGGVARRASAVKVGVISPSRGWCSENAPVYTLTMQLIRFTSSWALPRVFYDRLRICSPQDELGVPNGIATNSYGKSTSHPPNHMALGSWAQRSA